MYEPALTLFAMTSRTRAGERDLLAMSWLALVDFL
jgi:hypothetical protein